MSFKKTDYLIKEFNEIYEAILKNNPQHLFISSAGVGNRRVNDFDWPTGISLPNTISVAASTFNDEKAEFSSYGKPFINVFAPGKEITIFQFCISICLFVFISSDHTGANLLVCCCD